MPKVSIIVPVYRAEAYLHGCIDSILSQTFSDYELFLVDDGSPDRCGDICEEYAKQDARIQVLHQENQGQAAARNHALAKATGDWVCFVDSDDAIHPQMVQLLYDAARQSGAAVSMCRMLEAPELPEDFFQPWEGGFDCLTMDAETLAQLYDREEYPAWVACAKLIRRELVEAYPFTQGRVYEDNEAVCRWVCGAGKLARIPHDLYYYRTNPVSTTQRRFSLKKLDYLWALESIASHYAAIGFGPMHRRFTDRYLEEMVNCCNGLRFMLKEPERVKDLEKDLRRFLKKHRVKLTKAQFESLFDVFHPKLIRFYWPVEGAVRTVRETGVSGLVRKVKEQLGKGDRP